MWARIGCLRAIRLVCVVIVMALWVSERAEAGKVRGTVVDREGKSAAGAKVWIAKIGYLEPLEAHEATAEAQRGILDRCGPRQMGRLRRQGRGGRRDWMGFGPRRSRTGRTPRR